MVVYRQAKDCYTSTLSHVTFNASKIWVTEQGHLSLEVLQFPSLIYGRRVNKKHTPNLATAFRENRHRLEDINEIGLLYFAQADYLAHPFHFRNFLVPSIFFHTPAGVKTHFSQLGILIRNVLLVF